MFKLRSAVLPRSAVAAAASLGAVAGAVYCADSRSAIHEYVFCPLIRTFTDAEQGHRLGVTLMKYGLVPRLLDDAANRPASLQVTVFGRTLNNPLGVAAGLDKEGEAIDALFDMGFLYVEIGSVTPEPQPGNPQPRFFRLPRDDAVINRYGFNSLGHWLVVARLKLRLNRLLTAFERLHFPSQKPFGNLFRDGKLLAVNLGKNKHGDEVDDYVKGVARLGPYADVLVVNVLSPNTPGLRDLQSELKLTNLLEHVVAERNKLGLNALGRKPPVMVKVAPDLSEPEIVLIAAAAKLAAVDGIIVSNTTVQRPAHLLTADPDLVHQAGGLLGAPLKPLSLRALRLLRQHTRDLRLVLVGCGGILSGHDALEFARAGATFVQMYTAFAYKGPGLPAKIRDELAQELRREGKTWQQVVASS
jgi:dihydroorotate dehydrogenase